MNFEEFAQINEDFLEMTPTQMIKQIEDTNMGDGEKIAFKMWSKTYPNNGVGEAGLVKRISEYLNVDENTLETLIDVHGGLPDAIQEWGENNLNEEIPIQNVSMCLYAEDREFAYTTYMDLFRIMTALERKWLTAFILKKTRNGTDDAVVKKMISKCYGFKPSELKKASNFLSMDELITKVIDEGSIEFTPTAGRFMKPMLAKGGTINVRNRRWCDYKYDGIRAQIHNGEDGITIFNRKGDDITNKYILDLIPNLMEICDPVDWIIDGEIYPIDTDGNPAEFKNIMSRIHGKTDEVIYRNPVVFKAFDCLMYGGQPVYDSNLDTRLDTLKLHFDETILAETTEINNQDEMNEYYNKAIEAGFEGVIVKDPNMSYAFGSRSKGWLKFKPPMVDIDCVITNATLGAGKRKGLFGSYEIAIRDDDGLIPFGSVGSGFTDDDLIMITAAYKELGANRIIIEVKGDMITKNENGDYGLRFPRYVKYRDDKDEPTHMKELKI